MVCTLSLSSSVVEDYDNYIRRGQCRTIKNGNRKSNFQCPKVGWMFLISLVLVLFSNSCEGDKTITDHNNVSILVDAATTTTTTTTINNVVVDGSLMSTGKNVEARRMSNSATMTLTPNSRRRSYLQGGRLLRGGRGGGSSSGGTSSSGFSGGGIGGSRGYGNSSMGYRGAGAGGGMSVMTMIIIACVIGGVIFFIICCLCFISKKNKNKKKKQQQEGDNSDHHNNGNLTGVPVFNASELASAAGHSQFEFEKLVVRAKHNSEADGPVSTNNGLKEEPYSGQYSALYRDPNTGITHNDTFFLNFTDTKGDGKGYTISGRRQKNNDGSIGTGDAELSTIEDGYINCNTGSAYFRERILVPSTNYYLHILSEGRFIFSDYNNENVAHFKGNWTTSKQISGDYTSFTAAANATPSATNNTYNYATNSGGAYNTNYNNHAASPPVVVGAVYNPSGTGGVYNPNSAPSSVYNPNSAGGAYPVVSAQHANAAAPVYNGNTYVPVVVNARVIP